MSLDSVEYKSRILSLVLDFLHTNHLEDADDFSIDFAERIVSDLGNLEDFPRQIHGIKTAFFRKNRISKKNFIQLVNSELLPKILKFKGGTIITVSTLFPEIQKVSYKEAEMMLPQLNNISERELQDALGKILRKKGAYPIHQRFCDTPLEIADIEIFRLGVKNKLLQ
jgi:hypothetical protein